MLEHVFRQKNGPAESYSGGQIQAQLQLIQQLTSIILNCG